MKRLKKNLINAFLPALAIAFLASCSSGTKPATEVPVEDTTAVVAEVKELGVQIYSVRDALKEDFKGTLAKIASIGYKNIEAYGLGTDGMIYGMTPEAYKAIADSIGLNIVSTHATYFTPEEADPIIAAAKVLDAKYVVIPYLAEELRDYDAFAENLNKVGEKFQGTGIKFAYHNHAFEFEPMEDGRIPEEVLIEGTNPDLVSFQADLYWVRKAGVDPMTFLSKYPGRFSLFHVKDADDSLNQTTVGSGIIDFKSILNSQDVSGYETFFVEDERTDDPMANIQGALEYLNELEY